MHSTNYFNTFIQIAEDCPVAAAEIPPLKGDNKSVAHLQLEMILEHPYHYTSDDVIFSAYALKNGIDSGLKAAREAFFSKGQACLRASPLTKRYGWGIHHDAGGKIAAYPAGSEEYQRLLEDSTVKKVRAMRSRRG